MEPLIYFNAYFSLAFGPFFSWCRYCSPVCPWAVFLWKKTKCKSTMLEKKNSVCHFINQRNRRMALTIAPRPLYLISGELDRGRGLWCTWGWSTTGALTGSTLMSLAPSSDLLRGDRDLDLAFLSPESLSCLLRLLLLVLRLLLLLYLEDRLDRELRLFL